MRRSNEPIAWSLFGAGGMLLALLGPGVIITTGLLLGILHADDPARVYHAIAALLANPLGKLFVLALVALPLYHTLHRIHHGLHDLHLDGPRALMPFVFYGLATVLSIATASWLLII
jgi:fumarate reductase subunit D